MLRSILKLLTRNLGIKILALLMAGVVYAHVFTEEEREWEVRAPLRLTGLAPTLVLEKPPPETVLITVRGKGKQLLKLQVDPPRMRVDVSRAGPGRVQRFLSPVDVALPVGADVTVARIITPVVVTLVVDTLVTRDVAVRMPLLGEAPQDLALLGPVRSHPTHVSATGPSRALDRLEVTSDPFQLADLASLDRVELAVHANQERVSLDPQVVTVTAETAPMIRRTLPPIVVEITGAPPGVVTDASPDTALVTVLGPQPLVDSLDVAAVRVRLLAGALTEGRHLLTPDVVLPNPAVTVEVVRPLRFFVDVGPPSGSDP